MLNIPKFESLATEKGSLKNLGSATHWKWPNLSALPAYVLIGASATLGATFAWQSGIERGWLVASALVAFAIASEVTKPVAVVESFKALATLQLGRVAALGTMAALIILYSLSAELGLVSGARSDLAAKREAAARPIEFAKSQVAAAEKELATLSAPARDVAEIDAVLGRLKADVAWKRSAECQSVTRPDSAKFCGDVATLIEERARAARIGELKAKVSDAQRTLASPVADAVSDADPSAASVVAYLGIWGWHTDASTVSKLTYLIAVLAVEVCSAFSLLLWKDGQVTDTMDERASELSGTGNSDPAALSATDDASEPEIGAETPSVTSRPAMLTDTPLMATRETSESADPGVTKSVVRKRKLGARRRGDLVEDAQGRILAFVQKAGGKVDGASVRGLGKMTGTKRSTTHDALTSLLLAGLLAKVGSALVLGGTLQAA